MKQEHLQSEKRFYKKAYANNPTRRERGYGWEFTPSKTVVDLFEKHIGAGKEIRVLDIGCGDGRHTQYFASRVTGMVIGVDFSPEAVDLCAHKFMAYTGVHYFQVDMTKKDALSRDLGKFDLVIEWSVMDHIRREYLECFKKNVFDALEFGGYLISAQLSPPFPNHLPLKKGTNYRLKNGHYTRAYTAQDLRATFPSLKVVETRRALEDEKNGFWVETALFKK